MTLQVIVSSRGLYPVETYVGDRGQIFYDEVRGDLRIGDGGTPGGIPLTFPATFESSTITNQPELTINEFDGGDFLLLYDASTGALKKATLSTLFGQSIVGYTGSQGDPGVGISSLNIDNNELVVNYTDGILVNLGNIVGYTGSQGPIGYTGSSGSGGASNLVFTENGNARVLSSYRDEDGETYPVRTAELTGGVFRINLASFTPVLTSSTLPSGNLLWDQPCQGFTVSVNNPEDFLGQYISSVKSLEVLAGNLQTQLNQYNTTGPTSIPGPGVDWNQTYTVTGNSFIRSNGTGTSGGSAGGRIKFNVTDAETGEVFEHFANTSWAVNWGNPTLSVVMSIMTGNSFLRPYNSTSYSITVGGMSNAANYSVSVTATGGTPSNLSTSGTLTFTTPIHKNNTNILRTINVSVTYNRPQQVTGTAYSVTLTASDSPFRITFTYPSFWLFTANVVTPPTLADIVNGESFTGGVTALGDQAKTFSAFVNNNQNVPRVFWMGVRSSASQPTVFQTGANASLLSDVLITTSSVSISPTTPPQGFVAEPYNLYGIILQPGSTYVKIL